VAGLAAARARGRNGGCPSKLTPDQVRAARRLYDEREHTVEQIGSMFGVSRTSLYRALRDTPGQAKPAGTGGAAGRPAGTARAGDAARALTERELQVLRGMAAGRSNARIARSLYLSEDTVKTHTRRLYRKLGVNDRAPAVALGFRGGLVS